MNDTARTEALDELTTLIGRHTNWFDDDPANAPYAILDAGYRKAPQADPEAADPAPALVEAAYIAQDNLATPPDRRMLQITAEVVNAYLDALDHKTVHVLGHPADFYTKGA